MPHSYLYPILEATSMDSLPAHLANNVATSPVRPGIFRFIVVFAAMLGIVTRFCSCSAVPLFIGFVTTGVPLGVTFSFLVSAPMVNEVALVMLFGLFGWKIAGMYLATGLMVAMVSGGDPGAHENGATRRGMGVSNSRRGGCGKRRDGLAGPDPRGLGCREGHRRTGVVLCFNAIL